VLLGSREDLGEVGRMIHEPDIEGAIEDLSAEERLRIEISGGPNALRLAALMSCISEDMNSASWTIGLEHQLWQAVCCGNHAGAYSAIESDEQVELMELALLVYGWIVWDPRVDGRAFVSIGVWKERHGEWLKDRR
jgi:hypothetical protein